jgi:DNA-binding transcriptional LysR family regulator
VTRFLERTPDAQISIREGLYATLQPALAAGELDLIIGSEPSAVEDIDSHPGMKFELLGHLRPAIVVRAAHPLAKKRRVTLHDLQQARWIVPHGNTASARTLSRGVRAKRLAAAGRHRVRAALVVDGRRHRAPHRHRRALTATVDPTRDRKRRAQSTALRTRAV